MDGYSTAHTQQPRKGSPGKPAGTPQGTAWGPQQPDARQGLKRTRVAPEHQERMRHFTLPRRLEQDSSSSHSRVLLAAPATPCATSVFQSLQPAARGGQLLPTPGLRLGNILSSKLYLTVTYSLLFSLTSHLTSSVRPSLTTRLNEHTSAQHTLYFFSFIALGAL